MTDDRTPSVKRSLTPRLQLRLDQLEASLPLPERLHAGMTLPDDPIVVPLRLVLRQES